MSYILDALRRADAERERGRVPGLHTRIAPARSGLDEPAVRSTPKRSGRLLAAALLTLAVVGALAWWWTREPTAPAEAPAPTPPTAPVSAVPSSPVPSSPLPSAPVPPAPVVAAPTPVQPILSPAPPTQPPAPRQPAVRSVAPAPTAAGTSPAGADADLPRVVDLPPTTRAGLPPLQVSGVTYADNPALRMLIIDGKVIQQSQDIAPGLTVESIGPRAAVLNHQGRRLRLTY